MLYEVITVGFNGDHLGVDAIPEFFINVFQVRGFAAPTGTVINNFYLAFFIFQIYKCHTIYTNSKTPNNCRRNRNNFV